jgi:hypothetical protein
MSFSTIISRMEITELEILMRLSSDWRVSDTMVLKWSHEFKLSKTLLYTCLLRRSFAVVQISEIKPM